MSDGQSEAPIESSTFDQQATGSAANGSGNRNGTAGQLSSPATATEAKQQNNEVDEKIEMFEIHVESNSRNTLVFMGGDVVKGTIVMSLTQALEVESLDLALLGGATVEWKVNIAASGNHPEQMIEKRDLEYYVNEAQNILGVLPGESLLVSKGTHKFRFHFRLPHQIPASFQGAYGNVNYILKAVLKTTMGTNMYVAKVNVQQYLETPSYVKFLSPAEIRIKKNYNGKGIKSMIRGPIEAVFAVTRMGFTFGEPIEINGHVLNRSHATVVSIEVNLVQRCIYFAQDARTNEARVVKKVEDSYVVEHHAIRRWKDVKLVVPEDCAPSYLDGCKLLETYYELGFVINVKNEKPMVAMLPVVIGLGSLQHTVKAELDRQRSSAPVSPSMGTLKTQVFDYGTIASSSGLRADYPAQRPSNGGEYDFADGAAPRQEEQQRRAQRPVQHGQPPKYQYDDALE